MQTSSCNKDEQDTVESQDAPKIRFSDPRMLNMEEYEGMGFDENNYSPIPPFSQATSQHITPRPTSTPKLTEEIHLNTSDPTHNRGKIIELIHSIPLKNGCTRRQKHPKEDLSKARA